MCGRAVLVEIASLGQGRLGVRAQRTNNGRLILPQILGRSARRERSDVAPMPTGGHPSSFSPLAASYRKPEPPGMHVLLPGLGNVPEGREKAGSPIGIRGHCHSCLDASGVVASPAVLCNSTNCSHAKGCQHSCARMPVRTLLLISCILLAPVSTCARHTWGVR